MGLKIEAACLILCALLKLPRRLSALHLLCGLQGPQLVLAILLEVSFGFFFSSALVLVSLLIQNPLLRLILDRQRPQLYWVQYQHLLLLQHLQTLFLLLLIP